MFQFKVIPGVHPPMGAFVSRDESPPIAAPSE
jgi:hypothetical protein